MEVIGPPSVLSTALSILRDGLSARGAATPVFATIPQDRPARFVHVDRMPGSRPNMITDAPTITVQVWDYDKRQGKQWCETMSTLCESILSASGGRTVGAAWVRKWSGSPPYWFPDEQGIPRFQFVGQLFVARKPL